MANILVNGLNIGTDISVTISDNYGDVFTDADIGNMMSFNVSMDMHMLKVTPITNGGKPIYRSIPNGLSGTMEYVRVNGNITSIFTVLYAAFYNAGLLPTFTITVTVINRNGTTDEYIFPEVVFHTPDFGRFDGISEVRQKIDFSGPEILSTTNLASILSGMPTTSAA